MAGIADKSPALTVSEAVGLASRAVGALPTLTVTGEVTGYRGPNARSGHYYFDVKDESCVMSSASWARRSPSPARLMVLTTKPSEPCCS